MVSVSRHGGLERLLARRGLGAEEPPSADEWRAFLEGVGRAFETHDRDRALLERSLRISSAEMAELYEELRRSSESELAAERDKLRESERRLGEAQQLARLGSWAWDVGANVIEASWEALVDGITYGLRRHSA